MAQPPRTWEQMPRRVSGAQDVHDPADATVSLSSIDDLDDEAVSMLSRAYHANL
jgi:hypothetical protein